MTELLHRASVIDQVAFEKREIDLNVMPYNTETDIGPYLERFAPGSFRDTLAKRGKRVKMLLHHDRSRAVGRAISWQDSASSLMMRFKVSKTREGDEALEQAADGTLEPSVGFAPVKDRKQGKLIERLAVQLYEVSLVALPQYEAAGVLAVRSEDEDAQPLLHEVQAWVSILEATRSTTT